MNILGMLFWISWLLVGLATSLSLFAWHLYKRKLFEKITKNTNVVVKDWLFYSLIKDQPVVIFLMDVFVGYAFSMIFLFVLSVLVIIII